MKKQNVHTRDQANQKINPITRKAVDLDEETIILLTAQAIRAKKSLKPYLEDVLIAQAAAQTEVITEEHY